MPAGQTKLLTEGWGDDVLTGMPIPGGHLQRALAMRTLGWHGGRADRSLVSDFSFLIPESSVGREGCPTSLPRCSAMGPAGEAQWLLASCHPPGRSGRHDATCSGPALGARRGDPALPAITAATKMKTFHSN